MSPSAIWSALRITAVTTAFSIAMASATLTSPLSWMLPFAQVPFIRGN